MTVQCDRFLATRSGVAFLGNSDIDGAIFLVERTNLNHASSILGSYRLCMASVLTYSVDESSLDRTWPHHC